MPQHLTSFDVKSYLQDQLGERPPLASVQINYGIPSESVERSCIWLASVEGQFAVATMKAGRKHRDCEYTLLIVLDVELQAATSKEAEERVHAYHAELDDLLAEDASLGGLVQAAHLDGFEMPLSYTAEGSSFARIEQRVLVSNRLT
jgi:hypothetical protein